MFPNPRFSNLNGICLGHWDPGTTDFGHVECSRPSHHFRVLHDIDPQKIIQKISGLCEIYIAMPPYDPYVWWQQPWFSSTFSLTEPIEKPKHAPLIRMVHALAASGQALLPSEMPSFVKFAERYSYKQLGGPKKLRTESYGTRNSRQVAIELDLGIVKVHLWDMCLSWRYWETGDWVPMEIRGSFFHSTFSDIPDLRAFQGIYSMWFTSLNLHKSIEIQNSQPFFWWTKDLRRFPVDLRPAPRPHGARTVYFTGHPTVKWNGLQRSGELNCPEHSAAVAQRWCSGPGLWILWLTLPWYRWPIEIDGLVA